MADKYSTIQQHQPLRVPRGWGKQEKALIVQLDEVFDDIYRRFGRLRMEDMGKTFRKRIEDDEGNIAEITLDITGLTTRIGNAEGDISALNIRAGNIEISVANKYDKASGITIDTNGIDISGSKYVKIESGCTLDIRTGGTLTIQSGNFSVDSNGSVSMKGNVEITSGKNMKIKSGGNFRVESGGTFEVFSTNFTIDAASRYLKTGDWKFDAEGMTCKPAADSIGFEISKYDDKDNDTAGLFYKYYTTTGGKKIGVLRIGACAENYSNVVERGFFQVGIQINDDNSKTKFIVPYYEESSDPFVSYIGSSLYPFSVGYINRIHGNLTGNVIGDLLGNVTGDLTGNVTGNVVKSSGTFYVYPSGTSDKKLIVYLLNVNGEKRIQLESDTKLYIKNLYANGDINGNLNGYVINKETTTTDLNNIKEKGSYWLTFTNMSNKPSGLSGTHLMDVECWGSSFVQQTIYTDNAVYTRKFVSSTWYSWYKFTGTAV